MFIIELVCVNVLLVWCSKVFSIEGEVILLLLSINIMFLVIFIMRVVGSSDCVLLINVVLILFMCICLLIYVMVLIRIFI